MLHACNKKRAGHGPYLSAMRALPLLLLGAAAGSGPPPCPCDDPSLCRPLSPQPPLSREEVVAFSSWCPPTPAALLLTARMWP